MEFNNFILLGNLCTLKNFVVLFYFFGSVATFFNLLNLNIFAMSIMFGTFGNFGDCLNFGIFATLENIAREFWLYLGFGA